MAVPLLNKHFGNSFKKMFNIRYLLRKAIWLKHLCNAIRNWVLVTGVGFSSAIFNC